MKKILLIALLLLSNQVQAADPPDWLYPALKVDNPKELAIWAHADEVCPVTNDELKVIISGLPIISRVKPLLGNEWFENSLHLNATVSCVKTDNDNPLFAIDVAFGNYTVDPPVSYPHRYRYIGIGAEKFIISNFKNLVEAAITDYIAANFDL